MGKYYSLEEAKRRFLENTKLSRRKITVGVSNINNICHHLGKAWIERNFQGCSGIAIFFHISDIGNQLKYIKNVGRYRILFKKLELTRTQKELNPFLTELSIVSKFAKYTIPVQYEPTLIVDKIKKSPDFKVKVNTNWVYFEICSPKNIMWAPLTKLSKQLFNTIVVDRQYSLFILLARQPSQEEVGTLRSTSIEMINKFESGSSSATVGNLAKIVIDDSDPRIVSRFIKVKRGYPTVNVCAFKNYNGKIQKINLKMIFTDDRAENILRREAHHFSKRTRNLIIFPMGSLGKSMAKWKAIISRRLGGKINRRINGVFLLDAAMSGKTGKTIQKRLIYIPHRNPYKPLTDEEVHLIKRTLLG